MQSVVAKGRLSRLTLIFFTYAVGMQRVRIKTVYYRVTSLPPVNLVGLEVKMNPQHRCTNAQKK